MLNSTSHEWGSGTSSFEAFAAALALTYPLEIDRALGFAWYLIRVAGNDEARVDDVVDCFRASQLSRPNKSRLYSRLRKHRSTLSGQGKDGICLRLPEMMRLDQEFSQFKQDRSSVLSPLAASLRSHAKNLQDEGVRQFVLETIGCLENNLFRAAIVLSWIGAISILQKHVAENHLNDFNADALAENLIKRPAKNVGDFAKVKESDFLDAMERLSLLTNGVKKELKFCLDRRNNGGHPNDVSFREAQVAAHIESLIDHVFVRYS